MPSPPDAEDELIARAVAGDADAFEALVKPHLGLFHHGILRILGDPMDAEDALQEALIAIHRELPRFEGRSRFSSWGYRVCLNAALMVRRSRVRVREREQREEPAIGPFDSRGHHLEAPGAVPWHVEAEAHGLAERREIRELFLQALETLPDGVRAVFVLKDLEDWDSEAIARHLGISPAAVRQRLHRARTTLQARLRDHCRGGRP
ncbi:MAG: sigma-70 family RNA polymerase sigma factor [Acidobacteria bacterium]|nr:sigma-70 family RNA polymerase sigma factor [Acidobacteriota bacterium]